MDGINRDMIIRDREKVLDFIEMTGKEMGTKLLRSPQSSCNYLYICNEIVDRCNSYPINCYGEPTIYEVMLEVYKTINVYLDKIKKEEFDYDRT